MLKIAIVDDENEFKIYFSKLVSDYFDKKKYSISKITTCCSGNEILSRVEVEKFDCIFLDIEVGNENGIEIAEIIKSKYPNINVVFVTNKAELVFESLKIKPDGFIRKSHIESEVCNWIDHYICEYELTKESFTIKENNKYINLKISEIFYFESAGNYICIYLQNRKFKIKSSLVNWEEKLKNKNFVRVHAGYLVNISKIFDITDLTITLENNVKIPISRNRKKSVVSLFYKGL